MSDSPPLAEMNLRTKRSKHPSRKKTHEEVLLSAFRKCDYEHTRWAHKETLESLGLLEDVQMLMRSIGIEDLLNMDHTVYPRECAHFLASFELVVDHRDPPLPLDRLGCIRFKVRGVAYEVTLRNLCVMFGFPLNYGGEMASKTGMNFHAWKLFAHGVFEGARSKAATICNPAVRYVHKIISQSIFARKETDRVRDHELALLLNGLRDCGFSESFDAEGCYGYPGINVGLCLASYLRYLKKDWILKQQSGAKIWIGGLLTPIFYACDVPLTDEIDKPRCYLDAMYLTKTKFLGGRHGEHYIYNFATSESSTAKVYLPNRSIVSLTSMENISFASALPLVLATSVEPDRARPRRRVQGESSTRGEASTQPESSAQGEVGYQELPLGSPRYYHARFEGRAQDGLQYALEGVDKNQRHGRWLSKSLHNVTKGFKKKIKSLEGTVSDLKSMVETFILRKQSPPRNEDGTASYEAALEMARRNSISHLPSHEVEGDREGPRASSHEQRRQRRRRHRHIQTPSPPRSDNELYHASDSYSEGW